MRIQLALEPSLFAKSVAAGPSSGPLAQLGGEIVLIELQGELNWEGDKAGGVVGVIGLDRPVRLSLPAVHACVWQHQISTVLYAKHYEPGAASVEPRSGMTSRVAR
jgi:hypothetical protein